MTIGSTTAGIHARTRHTMFVVTTTTTMAIVAQSTNEAATCPDGKLDVAGVAFMRGTSGRGRSTTVLATRNARNSTIKAPSTKVASRQCRATSNTIVATAAMATTPSVLAM